MSANLLNEQQINDLRLAIQARLAVIPMDGITYRAQDGKVHEGLGYQRSNVDHFVDWISDQLDELSGRRATLK